MCMIMAKFINWTTHSYMPTCIQRKRDPEGFQWPTTSPCIMSQLGSIIKWNKNARDIGIIIYILQLSSVAQSCLTLCDPWTAARQASLSITNSRSFTQTHVHWVGDAIQPSHPLLSPSPPAFNLPQHQGLFQWVSSSHQVAKVLKFQLQHQFFQWTFRADFL